MKKDDILFFSPFSGIWKHSIVEKQISNQLKNKFTVHKIFCDGYFSDFCTVMNAKNLTLLSSKESKDLVCTNCKKNREVLKDDYEIAIEINEQMFRSPEFLDFKRSLKSMNFESLYPMEFLGVKVGKIAIAETILKFKIIDNEFAPEQLKFYRLKITQCVQSILMAKSALSKADFKFVFIFSPQYAITGAFAAYCETIGITVYAIQLTGNFSERTRSVTIYNWAKWRLNLAPLYEWRAVHYVPSKHELNRATKHLKFLQIPNSPFVYLPVRKGQSIRY